MKGIITRKNRIRILICIVAAISIYTVKQQLEKKREVTKDTEIHKELENQIKNSEEIIEESSEISETPLEYTDEQKEIAKEKKELIETSKENIENITQQQIESTENKEKREDRENKNRKVEERKEPNQKIVKRDHTPEELQQLQRLGIIYEDELSIYSGEKIREERHLYALSVNGERKTLTYPIEVVEDTLYFPIIAFFDSINFNNYEVKNQIIVAKLGDRLEEVVIDFPNQRILKNNSEIAGDIKIFKNEIHISKTTFRHLFLNNLALNEDKEKLNMTLNFSSPKEIAIRQRNNARLLKERKEVNDILFTNNNKLFELGYLRTELNQKFKKNDYDKEGKWQSDWDARLEYQGTALYGKLTTNYDLKNHLLEDVKLRYDDIYQEQTLEIKNRNYLTSGAREWELSFRKDKGYVVSGSKNYIIREEVPIGSRVELLYLGVIIDIQDSENGSIEFRNSEIREDREYELKIYTPDGKIVSKNINTTSNYNQQNKGEVEYDINIRENHDIEKPTIDLRAYYGLTDHLTIGSQYTRDPNLINDEYVNLDKGRAEAIYSNFLDSFPYTLKIGGEKVFDSYEHKINEKNTKDSYTYDYLGQIDILKTRLKLEQMNRGKFFDNKRETRFSTRYSPVRYLDFEYEHKRVEKHAIGIYGIDYDKLEKNNRYSVQYSKSLKNLLVTADVEYSDEDGKEAGINLYYTGMRTVTSKLENRWKNDGKNYEVALSLFSNGNRLFDYNVEARYSQDEKDRFTFRFSTNYNNWLDVESFIDKRGNQNHRVGVDKIVDLRNIGANIGSMESSPVKVITYVDMNDNNIFDPDEKVLNGVEVEIANQKVITDDNGEAMFYGVPNQVIYDLNPKIKKPSFLLGNNKIQIQGKNTSTIVAHIPIKPMLTLTGIVNIEEILGFNNFEKMRLYDELLVTIKDTSGKVIDRAIPDETGIFEVSGLVPNNYLIEVVYMGLEHQIEGITDEVIKLSYIEKLDENYYVFKINSDYTTTIKKGEKI